MNVTYSSFHEPEPKQVGLDELIKKIVSDTSQSIKEQYVDRAIEVLNLAIKADPVALQSLCQVRVRANEALQNHPTIQIGKDDTLSVIGLINGLFGVDSNGNGPIGRIEDTESKEVTGFCRNSNFNFKEV